MSIRVLVADDHPLVRAGVVTMVTGTEIEVACEAADCEEAVRSVANDRPDVVLLDVYMCGAGGFAALKQIKEQHPELPVVMFSFSEELNDMTQARELGANGYLPKTASRDELLQTIRRAAAGKSSWTRPQLRRVSVAAASRTADSYDSNPLTDRERQVLRALTGGLTNEEIAQQLTIDVETVKHHIKNILRKLGVEDRTQAALWAVRTGMV